VLGELCDKISCLEWLDVFFPVFDKLGFTSNRFF